MPRGAVPSSGSAGPPFPVPITLIERPPTLALVRVVTLRAVLADPAVPDDRAPLRCAALAALLPVPRSVRPTRERTAAPHANRSADRIGLRPNGDRTGRDIQNGTRAMTYSRQRAVIRLTRYEFEESRPVHPAPKNTCIAAFSTSA